MENHSSYLLQILNETGASPRLGCDRPSYEISDWVGLSPLVPLAGVWS